MKGSHKRKATRPIHMASIDEGETPIKLLPHQKSPESLNVSLDEKESCLAEQLSPTVSDSHTSGTSSHRGDSPRKCFDCQVCSAFPLVLIYPCLGHQRAATPSWSEVPSVRIKNCSIGSQNPGITEREELWKARFYLGKTIPKIKRPKKSVSAHSSCPPDAVVPRRANTSPSYAKSSKPRYEDALPQYAGQL